MTLEEWSELPEDVEGELVDGFLVEEEEATLVHEVIVAWLIRKLGDWGEVRGTVIAASNAKFAVAPRTGRKPDLTMFLPENLPRNVALVRTVPYVAVEIVSQSARDRRRDRVEKYAEYAAFGIPWYWIVDPKPGSLEIFERGADGRYVLALSASGGVQTDVPGCEGLILDLDALWAQVDRVR